ncbi:chondroitin AC/alginate lyase, partial [Basidiobolus meristosporus CBS 931.73]
VSIDPYVLAENKQQLNSYDANLQDAFYTLKKKADRACGNDTIYTISTKTQLPPSKSRQDYLSLARYYWPNEKSPDGLPYKRRDGYPNPEINSVSDYQLFRSLVRDVQSLGLAYYFLENDAYAVKAIEHIRAWFVDNSTRMNPHLKYASYIRGEKLGRRQGIIDLNVLPDLFNVIPYLQESPQWTDELSDGLREWFTEYMTWLDESELGFLERTSHNNHATYFDVQYMAIALFLGRDDLASKVALNATSCRIDTQISPEGAQPHETLRATSWFYSIFNLNGLFHLAALSAKVGVDLYHYKGASGQSIKRALDYLLPYSLNQSTWPYPNVG